MNGRIAKKKTDKMCKEKLKISGAKEHRASHKSSQGWRGGESACLPPMWPGFKSRGRRHRWVEFVVGSLLCSERFFSGYKAAGFPLSSKTNISKLQFDQESGRRRATSWMCYLQIIIYLFNIYKRSLRF